MARQLWAITAYFNPVGFRRRLESYRVFRSRLRVPLVTVEWAEAGRYQLGPDDADVLVQLSGRDVLWQKERLLNLALAALPPQCDVVAWLDGDVVFGRPDWAERTVEALARFPLVQPFHRVYELARDVLPEVATAEANAIVGHGMLHLLATGQVAPTVLQGNIRLNQRCHTGLAWAARRELLEQDGFYDACIVGSGNRAMICAALGRPEDAAAYLRMGERWREHYLRWAAEHFSHVRGSVGFVEGELYHVWHGDLKCRRYQERHEELAAFAFDPAVDIALEANGCWRWNSAKDGMHACVQRYFQGRREDGD